MAFDQHLNLVYSTVATAPSPAGSGTSLTLAAGASAWLPAVPFNATVWPAGVQATNLNAEIVRVTAKAGDVLTIVRAAEDLSTKAIAVGWQFAATITAKTLTDVEGPVEDARLSSNVALRAGGNTFTANQAIISAVPALLLRDMGQPVDARQFNIVVAGQLLYLQSINDAGTIQLGVVTVDRVGNLLATGVITEQSRPVPMGYWQDFTPSLSVNAGTVVITSQTNYRYMLLGKTCFFSFYLVITLSGTPTTLTLNLPAGIVNAAGYTTLPFSTAFGMGIAQTTPGTSTVSLYRDFAVSAWPTATQSIAGVLALPIA